MERLADMIADSYKLPERPAAGDTLEEAVWLEEQPLGYPLNLMCSLYYESSFVEPLQILANESNSSPADSDE